MHDLEEIYNEVNLQYFQGKIHLPIKWFGNTKKMPRSRMSFGLYDRIKKEIRINRLISGPEIPRYFIAYIIYHEMLHFVLPPIERFGFRRQIHHAAFKAREKEFGQYQEAKTFLKSFKKDWERKLLSEMPARFQRRK